MGITLVRTDYTVFITVKIYIYIYIPLLSLVRVPSYYNYNNIYIRIINHPARPTVNTRTPH